jgi:hypothetical protein
VRLGSAASDLAIGVTIVVTLARFAPDPFTLPIASCLLVGVFFAGLQVEAEADPAAEAIGVPIESVLLPGLVAVAALGAIRLIPAGLLLAPAVVVVWVLLALALTTEARLVHASGPPSSADRTSVLIQLLVAGFLAFIGVAALAPGGMPDASGNILTPTSAGLAVLSVADAAIGFLLGYRSAALRSSNVRDVLWFAVTAAAVMAIAAVAVRSIDLPRLLGPALLVVVFFLWDAIHGGSRARRRDTMRLWETLALAVVALAVVAWSLGIRP